MINDHAIVEFFYEDLIDNKMVPLIVRNAELPYDVPLYFKNLFDQILEMEFKFI